jgi:type VI secretion system secreted protein Hcp
LRWIWSIHRRLVASLSAFSLLSFIFYLLPKGIAMTINLFIKIADIIGESTDDRHKDEIDVLSWAWGVSMAGSMNMGGGAGAGKANFSDLTFTHHVDKATPKLFNTCATGKHVKEAKLIARKTGEKLPEFLLITMSDVLITHVAPAGNVADGSMLESVSLQFARVDMEYKPQLPDGSLNAGVHFTYDLKANKPV